MRKTILTLVTLCCVFGLYAASPVIISGTWSRGNDKEVKLFRTVDGRLEEMVNYILEPNQKFYFAFEPDKEGFYTIGNTYPSSIFNKYTFYFKPGDKLSVAVNDSSYTLTGTNTPENMAMEKWHNTAYSAEIRSAYFMTKYARVKGLASTYVDFFPYLEDFSIKAKTHTAKTGNKTFDNAFVSYRDLSVMYYACLFVQTPRTAHPSKEDFDGYYLNMENISKLTANTSPLYDYPFGISLLSLRRSLDLRLNKPEMKENTNGVDAEQEARKYYESNSKRFLTDEVKNDTLKGDLALYDNGRIFRTIDQYNEFKNEYGKYLLTEDQQNRLAATLASLNKGKKLIDKAIDFSGTDLNDKKVSLSDFKGKVVYVDVWATWCGPCRKELPFMKKMEEEYSANNDMVFLSISIDDVKDKQKWADFVKKEDMKGVQLFGGKGKESDVAKFYNITGIPRFMLFDKQGNLVAADAPRPSDPELKPMLEKALGSK